VRDERELVRQAQKLDENAVAELYEHYFSKIFKYIILKVGNRMEAEDLTQQVFLNAMRSLTCYEWRGTPFSAWLFRIAHNQVVDYLRKKDKQQLALEGSAKEFVQYPDPVDNYENKLTIEDLYQAMQYLTEAQREVISLRFSGDIPIAEVAQLMGRSQGAIKALQHSAIVTMRKILNGKRYEA
jgi:RNA polymerase sigma-70 factor, ECF subfamily